jgi:hypothetical protein
LRELGERLLALSAILERHRLQGDSPQLQLYFSIFNGSRADIEISEVNGSLLGAGLSRHNPARLVSRVIIRRGKIGDICIVQALDGMAAGLSDGNAIVASLRELSVRARPTTAPDNAFDLALPEALQFRQQNHWQIDPDTFVRAHKQRLNMDTDT